MAGRAYDPRFVFTWPNHRIAVMGPEQLAGVLSIVRRNAAEAAGRPFDEEADNELRMATEAQIEEESTALFATGRLWDDGIIDPRDTRTVLAIALDRGPLGPGEGHRDLRRGPALVAPARLRRVLVANRGEIARRIIRGAHDMGLEAVAVYTAQDAQRPTWARRTWPLELPGTDAGRRRISNPDALVDWHSAPAADALHPGYGFLSENPVLPEACAAAQITWVGPTPASMRVMGHKVRAKETRRGRRCARSCRASSRGRCHSRRGPGAVRGRCRLPAARQGVGRRRRPGHASRPGSRRTARGRCGGPTRAGAAFGSDEVFLERYLVSPRHVEVQIVGDSHGDVVHLFDRECSVQRRHQKIVEEAPRCWWDGDAGAHVAGSRRGRPLRRVPRRGDGRVPRRWRRLLLLGDEHPPAGRARRDRARHRPRSGGAAVLGGGGSTAPFAQEDVTVAGHAIEARLCAERPGEEYRPTPGTATHVRWPHGAGVRCDTPPSSRGARSARPTTRWWRR